MFSKKSLAIFAVMFYSVFLYAHQNHRHGSSPSAESSNEQSSEEKRILEQINLDYQTNVRSIFQSKCMTCHSSQTDYPFYYHWPIAKKIIDEDVAESQKHLDMTNGFPFAGHGTPAEDLEAIKKAASEGSMPPLRYRIMHWGSGLTETEKKLISDWAVQSLKVLSP